MMSKSRRIAEEFRSRSAWKLSNHKNENRGIICIIIKRGQQPSEINGMLVALIATRVSCLLQLIQEVIPYPRS